MLLFDQNLSPKLPSMLSKEFPGSRHVRDLNLDRAVDETVWAASAAVGLAIVSKDSDFQERSLLLGPPPKIIWIQRGNCSTDDIVALLREYQPDVALFLSDPKSAMLELA